MSKHSIISLILFLTLLAFTFTASPAITLLCFCAFCAIWLWRSKRKPSAHFQRLARKNADLTDQDFVRASPLTEDQSRAVLTTLRAQMPRSARKIALRSETHLFDELYLDPVRLELDDLPKLCATLALNYNVDPNRPIWDHISTVGDLCRFIASLTPKR